MAEAIALETISIDRSSQNDNSSRPCCSVACNLNYTPYIATYLPPRIAHYCNASIYLRIQEIRLAYLYFNCIVLCRIARCIPRRYGRHYTRMVVYITLTLPEVAQMQTTATDSVFVSKRGV